MFASQQMADRHAAEVAALKQSQCDILRAAFQNPRYRTRSLPALTAEINESAETTTARLADIGARVSHEGRQSGKTFYKLD
jgi:cell pole-organizing protein PopZ